MSIKSKTSSLHELESATESLNLSSADTSINDVTPPAGSDVSEGSKFKELMKILGRALNVKDLSSLRISLPPTLLEPLGNLEYWQYCERPDFFAAMPESEDELERMLAVIRWTFTKDLKFVKHKIAKPYNSVLGEHFHAHWDVEPLILNPKTSVPEPSIHLDLTPTSEAISAAGRSSGYVLPEQKLTSSASSVSSSKKSGSGEKSKGGSESIKSISTSISKELELEGKEGKETEATRTVLLNEQVSHHPPISHFRIEARGPTGTVIATGADQLGAKFTGTTVKVFPGPFNKGIFVTMPDRANEEYQITHPTATVAGLIRASPYATIGESSLITCRKGPEGKKKLRCILNYLEESWLLKPKFQVVGVIYEYTTSSTSSTSTSTSISSASDDEEDEDNEGRGGEEDEYTKVKHVPLDKIVATLEGCWRGEIRYKLVGSDTSKILLDLLPLSVIPKKVSPLETQHPYETRKVWQEVTKALLKKEWNVASKAKAALEQAQRDLAEERKERGEKYVPAFFEPQAEEWDGRPILSDEGIKSIEKEFRLVLDQVQVDDSSA